MSDLQLEANKELVRVCLETFSKGDIAGVAALMADDARWIVMGKLEGMSGSYPRDEFVALADGAKEAYREKALRIEPIAMTAEGGRVAVEAKGYAELADGRVYAPDYHLLFVLEDGRIAEVHEYMDTHHAFGIFFSA